MRPTQQRLERGMLKKLREILLTRNIGSILIALLAWQVMIEIVSTLVRIGFWFFTKLRSQSVSEPPGIPFEWNRLIVSIVTLALYLLAAYLIARWLYPGVGRAEAEAQSQDEAAQP
jgi:hypothetical protein